MPTNSYDLIVIGEDFAGLVAATLCAKRGMRVLILSHGAGPHGYQIGPHKLPIEPLAMCGLDSPAVKRVINELHLGHTLKRKLIDSPVSFQFVAPNVRMDATADKDKQAGEFEREFEDPAEVEAVCEQATEVARQLDLALSGDNEFPPTGFWKRREVGKNAIKLSDDARDWVERSESDAILRALIGLPVLLGAHVSLDSVNPEAKARSFHLWRQSAPRVLGDWSSLREIFLERFTRGNGETRDARVAELTFSWGRVNGVRLESGEELGAGHVIAAIPVADLQPLIDRKVPKRLAQCVEGLEIAGYRYTLNMVVNEAGIPEGMASPVLITSDPDKPLIGDNAIAVFLAPPDDEAQVVVTVTAVCPAPLPGHSLDDAFADLRVRLRERLEMVMPFFSEHVLLAHAPHEAALPEGLAVDPGYDFPTAPTPVWTSNLDAALGVSAVPYSIGLKHLTIASSQVLLQLGVEGAFATGWCAAKLACDDAGKKRDYLKDEVLAHS